MKLLKKLQKLEVGKYYYTAHYTKYKDDEPQFKKWWKVIWKDYQRVLFCVIVTFNDRMFSYYNEYDVNANEKFYKDYEWEEISEDEFFAQVKKLKCQLNELLINKTAH